MYRYFNRNPFEQMIPLYYKITSEEYPITKILFVVDTHSHRFVRIFVDQRVVFDNGFLFGWFGVFGWRLGRIITDSHRASLFLSQMLRSVLHGVLDHIFAAAQAHFRSR